MTSKFVQVGGGGGDDETLDKGKKKNTPLSSDEIIKYISRTLEQK
ncbi:MAG: hypothetical protein WAM42_09370 [Candidatus Nitrosopolaris sp.]|jgi:hypothetical protein